MSYKTAAAEPATARAWRRVVAAYGKPNTRSAIFQLLNTGLPFAAIMAGIFYGLSHGIESAILATPLAAGLLIRLFMIQHDCGHGSFFASQWANDLLGRVLGVLTLTPYTFWRRSHARHHATSGNLDLRGVGDITTLTVREYLSLSRWRRFTYRLYRHPLVMFGIGPTYQFLIRHRIPTGHPRRYWREWRSILGTNAAIAMIVAVSLLTLGPGPFLLGYLPVILMAAAMGVWLFYVQHQFENTYWETEQSWEFHEAALRGSSYYDLPAVLRWFTANIGLHHIHHLSSRIPNYRLRECLLRHPELRDVSRLTLPQSVKCLWLTLWDEDQKKLVGFRHLRRMRYALLHRHALSDGPNTDSALGLARITAR